MYAKYVGTLAHIAPSGGTWLPDSYVGEVDEKEPHIAALLANGQLIEVDPALYGEEREVSQEEFDGLVAEAQRRGIGGVLQRMRPETLRQKIAEHAEANPDFPEDDNNDNNTEEVS